jgi:hypothetical protein
MSSVPGSIEKKAAEDATFCLINDVTLTFMCSGDCMATCFRRGQGRRCHGLCNLCNANLHIEARNFGFVDIYWTPPTCLGWRQGPTHTPLNVLPVTGDDALAPREDALTPPPPPSLLYAHCRDSFCPSSLVIRRPFTRFNQLLRVAQITRKNGGSGLVLTAG